MASSAVLKFILLGEDRTSPAWKSAAKGMDSLSKKSSELGKSLTMKVTAPLLAMGGAAVLSASDQEQAFGALDSVYKKNAASMKVWAARQSAIGLSASEASTAAVLFGASMKNAGLKMDDTAKRSRKLVGLAADLAATFGGTTSDAVSALGAAFRGEYDPLEKYALNIKQSTVEAEALKMGLWNGKGALDAHAQSLAVQALLWKQTKDAQGQARREQDSFAGSSQRAIANLKNAGATIGSTVLPAMSKLADRAAEASKKFEAWFSGLSAGGQQGALAMAGVVAAIGPLVWLFGKAVTVVRSVAVGIRALHTTMQVAAAIARVYGLSALGTVKVLAAQAAAAVSTAATWVASHMAMAAAAVKSWVMQAAAATASAAAWVRNTAALVAHRAISLAVTGAAKAMAAAQWLVNVAMTANPIGLVVAVLVALGAGLVIAWKKSETFRRIVTGAFVGIGKGVLSLAQFWLGGMKLMVGTFLSFVGAVVSGAAKAFGWVPGVGPKLRSAAANFESFRSSVSGKFDAAGRKVDEWKRKLDAVDKKKVTADVDVDPSGAKKGAASAQSSINGVHGKTVDVNVRVKFGSQYPGGWKQYAREHGIPYAKGGLASFAHGGSVLGGGTGVSDSIMAALSNGEFVATARAVERYGADTYEAMNAGRAAIGNTTLIVNVNGGFASAGEIARTVTRAILDEERMSGRQLLPR